MLGPLLKAIYDCVSSCQPLSRLGAIVNLVYRGGVVVLGELIAHKQSCQGCPPPRGHLSLSVAPALTPLVHGQVFILLKLANLLSGSPLVSHPD